MPFPEAPRVTYQRNTLSEVVCQVRFPPVLRIETHLPDEFQERIRSTFPGFQESRAEPVFPEGIPAEVRRVIQSSAASAGRRGYEFVSAEQDYVVSLTRDSLALKTTRYTSWRNSFRPMLEPPLAALLEIYKPAYFQRIGLRYVNVIQRSKLDMGSDAWSVLLKPHIAGEFACPDVANDIDHFARETGFRLSPQIGKVIIRYGLGVETDSNEVCFLVDSDFFLEDRTETANGFGILDSFNKQARNLFRWCITDRLHRAMEPVEG